MVPGEKVMLQKAWDKQVGNRPGISLAACAKLLVTKTLTVHCQMFFVRVNCQTLFQYSADILNVMSSACVNFVFFG